MCVFVRYSKLLFMAFIGVAMNYSSLPAEENYWSCNGPWGGTVMTIAVNPLSANVIFIGTVQNGIYKTIDGGGHWQHIDTREMESNLRVIAIHPTYPDTMYAGTVQGVYRSADGGDTWELLSAPLYTEYRGFIVHPTHPNIIFGDNFKSTDSGETWYRPEGWTYANREWITVDPLNTDILYFASGILDDGRGVWKSDDMGQSWYSVGNGIEGDGFCSDVTVNPNNDNILFLSGATFNDPEHQDCIWRSTDSGGSWTAVTPLGLTEKDIRHTRVSPSYEQNVFACTSGDGVFKSTDLGDSWYPVNEGLRVCGNNIMEFISTKTGILLGTYSDGVARSIDEGEHWQNISNGINAADCLDLAIDPHDSTNIFVAAVNGLFHSTDSGENWEYVETPVPFRNFPRSVEFDKYVSGLVYLSDGAYNYTFPDTAGFYHSLNNGLTWTRISTNLPYNQTYDKIAISYHGFNDKRIFISGWNSLHYSDDNGYNWDQCADSLPPDGTYLDIKISPSNPDIIAVATFTNRLFISRDRGLTWREPGQLPSGEPYFDYDDITFHPFDSGHLYISGEAPGIYESFNYGADWSRLDRDLPMTHDYPGIFGLCINPFNPLNMFVTVHHFGVFQSTDGGSYWRSFNTGIDTIGACGKYLSFQGSDVNSLILATIERSVWTIHWDGSGVSENHGAIPRELSISSYPNPFNSSTKIRFDVPAKGNIALYICDIAGRIVKEFSCKEYSAGTWSIDWDGTDSHGAKLCSGQYFARILYGDMEKSLKLILLK
jgi:photosystem II stability/assembly factor-like uncharacterized protein